MNKKVTRHTATVIHPSNHESQLADLVGQAGLIPSGQLGFDHASKSIRTLGRVCIEQVFHVPPSDGVLPGFCHSAHSLNLRKYQREQNRNRIVTVISVSPRITSPPTVLAHFQMKFQSG